eukprot:jgi/Tetstr1/435070/TSEL_024039.t1
MAGEAGTLKVCGNCGARTPLSWPLCAAVQQSSPGAAGVTIGPAAALSQRAAAQLGAVLDVELPAGRGYVASVLPGEEELSVPFCLPRRRTAEFQHAALQADARAQRERLAALFPGSREPESNRGLPPLLAHVRARVWQLVALRDIAVGEEVCISYTGEEGYTNRRLMAQYGFVPSEGNPADRIDLEEDLGLSAEQLAGKQLSGSKLEAAVGPDLASMASGQNVYLFSTIRSLPLVDDEQQPLTGTEQFAELLLEKCKHALEAFPTTLEEDSATLSTLSASGPERAMAAATAYRLQRKQLLSCARGLLERYLKL